MGAYSAPPEQRSPKLTPERILVAKEGKRGKAMQKGGQEDMEK